MGEPRLLSNDELWAIQHTAASVNATTQDILHTALTLGNQIADLRAKLEQAEKMVAANVVQIQGMYKDMNACDERWKEAEARVRRLEEAVLDADLYLGDGEIDKAHWRSRYADAIARAMNPPSPGEMR